MSRAEAHADSKHRPVRHPDGHPARWATTQEHEAFRHFPYGLVVVDRDGKVVSRNLAAARLIEATGHDAATLTCCRLLGCRAPETVLAEACVTELALAHGSSLPEVRVDIVTGENVEAMWIGAAPLGEEGDRVVLQLRPGVSGDRRRRTDPHWMAGPSLRIHTLGRTVVESPEGPIGGSWLDQRTGQLLKYLVAERHRAVHADEIGENIWPEADFAIAASVRYYIHALRRKLEPQRGNREPSTFVISGAGCYRLNLNNIQVDADEFEKHVTTGLAAVEIAPQAAAEEIERGLAVYRGDFLADTPYADWAMLERHRLHDLACMGLRSLAQIRLDRQLIDSAIRSIERLAGLQPYDEDVHRQLLELYIARGRHSEAVRRYASLRAKIRRTFGKDPGFTLSELKVPKL
ncbi:MAG TPA: BTAD domain-containing putative transcriptional regulator [Solirubrobacteraceae bacterium]|nr:BTAD domain-containing putative transcriptional regulator [Solirubrobacteraceae bacterium]